MGTQKRHKSLFVNKIILYTIILPVFISPIIGSASMTQRQAVKADLGLSIVETQWLITAYTIFASSFLLFGGQLGDVFGHVKTFIAGLVLYITSCILF